MTDLTEQWKKGELPNGWYYVRLIRGEHRIDLYINSKNEWIDCQDNIIDTVVCKVPSYDAFMSLVSAYDNVTDENAKLKELLKEIIADADLSYCDSDIELRINEVLR